MVRRIPDELIEEIRSANDIVDVIAERIPIKKAGRNYKALCPFHQEKTPSFNINPERQIYHCFGCGAGGNVFKFLMEYERIGFLDAVRELADRAGIALPKLESRWSAGGSDDPIYATNALALEYYKETFSSGRGAPARRYWRERGLSDEVADEFGIGYAPPGWDGLIAAARASGVEPEALAEAGLVVRREDGGYYDRFRDRLIFPLVLAGGRVVGFGGRALGDQDPKYLNSPETRVYHKGRYLYGLAQARHALRLGREAILVEGYMDLLALCQAGFRNVVASAGTALTPEQAGVVARYADKVFVAYDGDAAGIAAASRAAEVLVVLGLKVRVVRFPDGADPDSFVRERGVEALREALASGSDFIDFLVSTVPTEAPEEREAVARRLIATVALIEDPLKADLMLEKISQALSIRRSAVTRAYAAKREEIKTPSGRRGGGEREPDLPIEDASSAAQKGLLAYLLAGGETARRIWDALDVTDFTDPVIRSVIERITVRGEPGRPVDVAGLVDEIEVPEAVRLLTELSVAPPSDEDGAAACDDYIRTVKRSRVEAEIKAVERAIETAELTNRDDELLSLAAKRQELARRLTELSG